MYNSKICVYFYNAIPKLLVSPIFWENNVFNLYTGLNFSRFVSTSLVDLIYCLRKYFPMIHLGGHRDWASTECPGTELYKRLPNIRQQVDLIAP